MSRDSNERNASRTGAATRFFDAQLRFARAEGDVSDVVQAALGVDEMTFHEWTADYYDESIEVYDVTGDVKCDAFWAAGFAKVWIHRHPAPRGNCKCPSIASPALLARVAGAKAP